MNASTAWRLLQLLTSPKRQVRWAPQDAQLLRHTQGAPKAIDPTLFKVFVHLGDASHILGLFQHKRANSSGGKKDPPRLLPPGWLDPQDMTEMLAEIFWTPHELEKLKANLCKMVQASRKHVGNKDSGRYGTTIGVTTNAKRFAINTHGPNGHSASKPMVSALLLKGIGSTPLTQRSMAVATARNQTNPKIHHPHCMRSEQTFQRPLFRQVWDRNTSYDLTGNEML